jgi:hypothetical protein
MKQAYKSTGLKVSVGYNPQPRVSSLDFNTDTVFAWAVNIKLALYEYNRFYTGLYSLYLSIL